MVKHNNTKSKESKKVYNLFLNMKENKRSLYPAF